MFCFRRDLDKSLFLSHLLSSLLFHEYRRASHEAKSFNRPYMCNCKLVKSFAV